VVAGAGSSWKNRLWARRAAGTSLSEKRKTKNYEDKQHQRDGVSLSQTGKIAGELNDRRGSQGKRSLTQENTSSKISPTRAHYLLPCLENEVENLEQTGNRYLKNETSALTWEGGVGTHPKLCSCL